MRSWVRVPLHAQFWNFGTKTDIFHEIWHKKFLSDKCYLSIAEYNTLPDILVIWTNILTITFYTNNIYPISTLIQLLAVVQATTSAALILKSFMNHFCIWRKTFRTRHQKHHSIALILKFNMAYHVFMRLLT